MQFIVISHQLWEILIAFSLGLFLGLVYDGVRFARRLLLPLRHEILISNIFDVLYFVFVGASYCIFLFACSNGRFRWFTALGALFGIFLYRLLPSRLIKPFLFFIADKAVFLLTLLLLPLKKLIQLLSMCFKSTVKGTIRKMLLIKTKRMKNKLSIEVKLS